MTKPRLIRAADYERIGRDPRQIAALYERGDLTRLRRGIYIKSADWNKLGEAERYGLRVSAFAQLATREPVLCHASAALLWGLWIVGTPSKIHVITEVTSSGRSGNGVVRHIGSLNRSTVRCGPYLLTGKLATTMGLIRQLSFPYAVAVCDSSLRRPEPRHQRNVFGPITPDGGAQPLHEPSWATDGPQGPALTLEVLRGAAETLPSKAAAKRTLAVINFASALSGSAGESISRAKMFQLGFPAPVLQQPFTLRDGSEAKVDFWFEEQRLVGEFDGKGKYLRSDWGKGKSIQDRVLAEKDREDQIRAYGVGFVRWTWAEMMNRERFIRLLRQAGLPQK